jgi:bacterioferritin
MSGELKHVKYFVKAPYPKIKVEEINVNYGDILLEDFAGSVSELTAINLYVFQHIVSEDIFKDYSELIRGIAIVEMKHLDLLGGTIKLLGVKPVYINSFVPNGQLWNASYVDFSDNILDMIAKDIESEEQAIVQYESHINLIHDRYVRRLLERIVMDEELHIRLFNRLYKKYSK